MTLTAAPMRTGPTGSLGRVTSRRTLAEVRRRLEDGASSYFEQPEPVELVAVHDHGNSTTGVLHVGLGAGARRLVVKTLVALDGSDEAKLDQITREDEALRRCTKIFAGSAAVGVPAPVALFPDLYALVMEHAPGTSLDTVLGKAKRSAGADAITAVTRLSRQCGEWLRMLQAATISASPAASVNVAWLCEERLAYFSRRRVLGTGFLRDVKAHVARLLAAVPVSGTIPVADTHGDLRPYNVIVSPDGERITVVDFGGFRRDAVQYDYLKFRTKLEMLAFGPLFRARDVRRFVDAFSEGYGTAVDEMTPVSQIYRIGFALDQMSECLDGTGYPREPLRRRLLLWLLFYKQYRRLKTTCRA